MTAGTLTFVGAEMPALFASHLTGSCLKPLALLFNIQPQRREEGSLGSHQGQESPWNLSSGNTASGIACHTGGPQPAALPEPDLLNVWLRISGCMGSGGHAF